VTEANSEANQPQARIDWQSVFTDHAGGMSISNLMKKYGIKGKATLYNNLKRMGARSRPVHVGAVDIRTTIKQTASEKLAGLPRDPNKPLTEAQTEKIVDREAARMVAIQQSHREILALTREGALTVLTRMKNEGWTEELLDMWGNPYRVSASAEIKRISASLPKLIEAERIAHGIDEHPGAANLGDAESEKIKALQAITGEFKDLIQLAHSGGVKAGDR
jgi:hypothetical protein